MKYIIRSAKTENTEAIKEYIESKLSKLDKYFETSDDIEATVLTKVNGREKVIEVTIPTKHFTLRNEEANEDLYAAIDRIADKLERQIRKNKEKINKKVNKTLINDFEYDLEKEKLALEKDYLKASHRYEKKLEGKDLRNKIIDTLLKKGYNYEDIKNILEVKENNDE
mgnify:CR=1 FL=1